MERDSVSRRVLYVAVAVAVASLWTVWALLYEATGFPGLNYLAFDFVSPRRGVAGRNSKAPEGSTPPASNPAER